MSTAPSTSPSASATPIGASAAPPSPALQSELEVLQLLRASLQSMKEVVVNIQQDVEMHHRNYRTLHGIEERWKKALADTEELQADEQGEKGKDKARGNSNSGKEKAREKERGRGERERKKP